MHGNSIIVQRRALIPGALVAATAVASIFAASASAQPQHGKPVRGHGHGHTARTLRVTAGGSIDRAIAKAQKGDTVMVTHGVYHEDVTVTKDIHLVGVGKPVVDARGLDNGIVVSGAGAKGAVVRGFTVRNATFEGLLTRDTTGVTVRNNVITGNDLGMNAATPTGLCAAVMGVPGDCGEGLHVLSTTHSKFLGNTSTNNTGGILVSDEADGPSAFDTFTGNTVKNNLFACGITLAGHNPRALTLGGTADAPTVTGTAPKVAGIYKNVVTNNVANGNGLRAQGGGILLAAAPPGAAVYDNVVKGNTANGNGLGGVTLHSHAPGQDLDGNTIVDNSLSNDGIAGGVNGAAGDSDAGITQTVGITIWSAVTPLKDTTIRGNHVSNDHFGIWTQNVPTIAASANSFAPSVAVPVFQK